MIGTGKCLKSFYHHYLSTPLEGCPSPASENANLWIEYTRGHFIFFPLSSWNLQSTCPHILIFSLKMDMALVLDKKKQNKTKTQMKKTLKYHKSLAWLFTKPLVQSWPLPVCLGLESIKWTAQLIFLMFFLQIGPLSTKCKDNVAQQGGLGKESWVGGYYNSLVIWDHVTK